MDKLPNDDLTQEEVIAKIEKVLRGKADGKGYTDEELDAYFHKTSESSATAEDSHKDVDDEIMRRLKKLSAMVTDMAERMERENAERLEKQRSR